MVNIICHRGFWKTKEEQNTLIAFERAFDAGLGVELDVRDMNGALIVSHDPPKENIGGPGCQPLIYIQEVLKLLGDRPNTLAVNVKSCGLAPMFAELKAPRNWFFFDMAVNDTREYRDLKLPVRIAGWSHYPTLLPSLELFGEPHNTEWEYLKKNRHKLGKVDLLTDIPQEALEFFGDKSHTV